MTTWDRRLTAATERLDNPTGRRALGAPELPTGLHPDDAAAAEALLRLAGDRRVFSAALLLRTTDDGDEPRAELRIEADELGVRLAMCPTVIGASPLADPLTALPGRPLLLDRIANALTATPRTGRQVAVLYVDVDGFKLLNDAFGYHAGDEVLRWVAARLCTAIRPADTLARVGGDEFVVVSPGVHSTAGALRIGDRLRTTMRVEAGETPPIAGLTVSVGIACGDGESDPDELLSNADTALFLAKASGRDRCQLFDDALRTRVERRIAVDRELRRALDAGDLELHFQPIVAVGGRHPIGLEALVRIATTDGGEIRPHELLQAAADNGLLRRVEAAVVHAACAQMVGWPGIDPALMLAVNVTERQFRDHELVRVVNDALRASSLPASRLCIEVTEETLAADTNGARGAVSRLRALGVRVSVDEFCGNESLLRLLPGLGIEQVKLDRSLVNVLDTEWGRALVHASIAKSSDLGLSVVAVGVETEEQLAFLQRAGATYAQGYLFERAVPAAHVPTMLTDLTDR